MKNVPDAKFPFGKNRRIQRNFIPISERIARFYTKSTLLGGATKRFDCVLNSKAESMRETELDFLCKLMVWPVEA